MIEYRQLSHQRDLLQAEFLKLKTANSQIETILALKSNASYSEAALASYGYKRLNETLVQIIPPEINPVETKKKSFLLYYLLGCFFLLSSIFVFWQQLPQSKKQLFNFKQPKSPSPPPEA